MSEPAQKGADEKYCTDCGSLIKARAEICPKCGVRQMPPPSIFTTTAPNGKNKLAAALFAIVLGGFGIHKFYLGSIGWGIAYLLFCWTFVPSIVGFIEGVLLLVMSDAEFNRKYGAV
ncbi:MAG TPA: NINE protein [Nitrospirota bacterium]|nr:NINE protein [Nitrospirota bacterium]